MLVRRLTDASRYRHLPAIHQHQACRRVDEYLLSCIVPVSESVSFRYMHWTHRRYSSWHLGGISSLFVLRLLMVTDSLIILFACSGKQNAGALLSFLSGYSWYVPSMVPSINPYIYAYSSASWVLWLGLCAATIISFVKASSTWGRCTIPMGCTDTTVAGTGVPLSLSCKLPLDILLTEHNNFDSNQPCFLQHPCICASTWPGVLDRT
jgi:hypothetical protein